MSAERHRRSFGGRLWLTVKGGRSQSAADDEAANKKSWVALLLRELRSSSLGLALLGGGRGIFRDNLHDKSS